MTLTPGYKWGKLTVVLNSFPSSAPTLRQGKNTCSLPSDTHCQWKNFCLLLPPRLVRFFWRARGVVCHNEFVMGGGGIAWCLVALFCTRPVPQVRIVCLRLAVPLRYRIHPCF